MPRKRRADGQTFFKLEETNTFSHLPEEQQRLKCSDSFYGIDGTVHLTSTGAWSLNIATTTKIRPPLQSPVHMTTHTGLTATWD